MVGEGALMRGDGPGWRFSGGILVFGGSLGLGEKDASRAVHLDNDFTNQGEKLQAEKTPKIIIYPGIEPFSLANGKTT